MAATDIHPAPILDVRSPINDKWENEKQTFVSMLPELLRDYRDQYVAIHNGKVVANGADIVSVGMQAYQKYGYVPIFVDLVTDKAKPVVRIPSPRVTEN